MKLGYVLAAALAVVGSAAQATTISATCTSNNTTTYTLTNSSVAECWSGNFNNQISNVTTVLGLTGWTLADLSNDANPTGPIQFDPAPIGATQGGAWGFDTFAGYDAVTASIMVILKAGNTFAAFLIDPADGLPSDPLSQWTSSRNLSHAGIYVRGTPSTVPLPAAGFLLLAGLGGLAALKRKQRKAA